MEHVNGWCFRGIYKGGLWEDDLHVSAPRPFRYSLKSVPVHFGTLGSPFLPVSVLYEPQHDKTNKMTCAPSEDSDKPGHPSCLISLRCPHEEPLGLWEDDLHVSAPRPFRYSLKSVPVHFGTLGSPFLPVSVLYEPQHDKTNKMTCAPSEDSDKPGHPSCLISLRCPHEEPLGP